MNKWLKLGLATTLISAGVSAKDFNFEVDHSSVLDALSDAQFDAFVIEASDLVAKKLRDRMVVNDIAIFDDYVIEAADLVAKKLRDRMIVDNEDVFDEYVIEAADLVAKKLRDR